MPVVSGIIIFLNGEKFFEEAIASVLAQTFTDWELLLVDDGSTDGSTAIARRYAAEHPDRIRYLEHPRHENRGKSAARNLGVQNARGEYIAFLDCDDVWLPNKLAEQVPLLAAHPAAGMLYGRTHVWFGWTGNPADAEQDRVTELELPPDSMVQPPAVLTRVLRHDYDLPCACSVLIRRQVFDRLGGFDESFRGQYEDMLFYAKIFLEYPVYVSSRCWDRYRQHPDSSYYVAVRTGLFDPGRPNPTQKIYFERVEQLLITKGAVGTEVWKILQRRRWPYRHPWLSALSAGSSRWCQRGQSAVRAIGRYIVPAPGRQWLRAHCRRTVGERN